MDRQFATLVAIISLLTFGGVWLLFQPDTPVGNSAALLWSRCSVFRAVGKAPLYRGDPYYRTDLDADGDGIACEGGASDRPRPPHAHLTMKAF